MILACAQPGEPSLSQQGKTRLHGNRDKKKGKETKLIFFFGKAT
jgi:hypothetical protein